MSLIERDLDHIWHPCSQMKDYQQFPPLEVVRAEGSYLYLSDGRRLLDAISSWWCKSLGHAHPRLQQAVTRQMSKFEHVIFANTTNDTIVELSERLAKICHPLSKVFFASEGSSAVEIAMKMSVHGQQCLGKSQRSKFMALSDGYHGETCLALAASDLGLYRKAYEPLLPEIGFVQNLPYVTSPNDPLWHDCSSVWPAIEQQLDREADQLAAVIFEPILQGAGGMRIYSQDFLTRLRRWAQSHGIWLIADEILTGFGRTGTATACEHAGITPDFICLSKGLTAGFLPMSAVLTSPEIYDLFYADYGTGRDFLHSHTHSGNALAAACALETLKILEDDDIYQQVRDNSHHLIENMQSVAQATGCLKNIRTIGWMAAADLETKHPRAGYAVFQQAIRLGALLRPLGNTLYWLPPLNSSREELDELRDITTEALLAWQGSSSA